MKIWILLLPFLFLAHTHFGQGLDKENSDTVSIENILVTHSKIPIQASNASKPVHIITAEALRRNSGSDLAQVLNDASGIDVVGSLSNPGKDKSVFLRGASGEFTVILVNGQPILDPSGIGGVADLRSIPIANIQRIEVLKGSQSTIYGSDAIAGVINIVTNSHSQKEGLHAGGGVSYGSFNTLNANLYANGQSGDLEFRIGLNRDKTDGISEALSNDPAVVFEKDGMKRLGFSAGIGYKLSDKVKINAFSQYSDYESDTDADSFTDSEGNTYFTELLNLGASIDYSSDDWQGALKYTLTSTNRNFLSDFGAFPFMGRFQNMDVYASKDLTKSVKFIIGLNYQYHGMLDETTSIPDPSVTIISPYASSLISLGERTNVEVGLRYNKHSSFGSNTNYSLAASHWISNDLKVFANHSTGFKAPSLFQLYGAFGANPELNPQKSQSYEIGFQAPHSSGLLNPQLTFFARNVDDLIGFENFVYTNFFNQNDKGVELELGFSLGSQVTLRLLYTYLDGSYKVSNSNTTLRDVLYRRPKNNFGVKAFYNATDKLNVDVSFKSVGERLDLFFNPANGFASEEVKLESYMYLTLHADYKISDKVSAFLDLKNLTNSNFQEVYGFSTPGSNFMFGVNWKL